MDKLKIKKSTIVRIVALAVALINQCLAIFGRNALPFTENTVYQVISIAAVITMAIINAWYNNDVSQIALICGNIFDSLLDGKITEEEAKKMLADAESSENKIK